MIERKAYGMIACTNNPPTHRDERVARPSGIIHHNHNCNLRGCDLNPHIDRSAKSCKSLILNDTPILRGQIQRYKARVLDSLVLEEKKILELPSIQMVEGSFRNDAFYCEGKTL
jgi:hypothetical protein